MDLWRSQLAEPVSKRAPFRESREHYAGATVFDQLPLAGLEMGVWLAAYNDPNMWSR